MPCCVGAAVVVKDGDDGDDDNDDAAADAGEAGDNSRAGINTDASTDAGASVPTILVSAAAVSRVSLTSFGRILSTPEPLDSGPNTN